jgi:large subunit ribosomal protein L19
VDDLKIIEENHLVDNIPEFNPGDTLKVVMSVKRGDRDRLQRFEGIVIKIKGSGTSKTFTLRKVSQGIGVEKIFPVHSPMIKSIEVVKKGQVRRAKLYYLRDKEGKAAKIKEKK